MWQHMFSMFDEARRVIRDWMQWYNQERPLQALAIKAQCNTGPNKQPRWHDVKGAILVVSIALLAMANNSTAVVGCRPKKGRKKELTILPLKGATGKRKLNYLYHEMNTSTSAWTYNCLRVPQFFTLIF